MNIHWKDWCWRWSSNALATWCEEPTHWKRPWCWKRFRAGGEWVEWGCDGWMASLTQWTWIWANSRRWWWTGKLACCTPWSCRVGHDWATEQHPRLSTESLGMFLVVQWLGLRASTTRGGGLIPGLGTEILHAALHGQKIINKKKNNYTKSLGRHCRGCGIGPGLWKTRWFSEMQNQVGGGKEESGSKRKETHMSRKREGKRWIEIFKKEKCGDFLGGMVVETSPSSAGGVGEWEV